MKDRFKPCMIKEDLNLVNIRLPYRNTIKRFIVFVAFTNGSLNGSFTQIYIRFR